MYEFNSLILEEFYAILLDAQFNVTVSEFERNDDEAISEEEYFVSFLCDSWWDSEGNSMDVEKPESLEELQAFVINKVASLFLLLADKPVDFGMEEETFVLILDIDERTLTHSDRETLMSTRVDASSVIEVLSWGQTKALYR